MTPNAKLALNAAGLAVAMLGLAYASVPLYDLFCKTTGYGGTTQQGKHAPGAVQGAPITISFNADTAPALPWKFLPVQSQMEVQPGAQYLAYYTAENLTDQPITGQAVYNVVPHGAGSYFTKIECFCFTKQTLQPKQRVQMPVSFYIDPAIRQDPELKGLKHITLSYTFFHDNQ